MINVRDPRVKWIGYAYNQNNPDGSLIFDGEELIELPNGEVWSYYSAIRKGIVYDGKGGMAYHPVEGFFINQ